MNDKQIIKIKFTIKLILLFSISVFSFTGCNYEEERRRVRDDYIQSHPMMDQTIKECLRYKMNTRTVCVGMTIEELLIAIDEYHDQESANFLIRLKKNRVYKDSYGSEAWEFGDTVYYFQDGKLESWVSYRSDY